MLVLFFAFWTFGAVLLLTCSALMWSDRISVLRTVPACANCGYSLVGLARTAKCPECGDIWRTFTVGRAHQIASSDSIMLWITPTVAGLIASGSVTAVGRIGTPDNVIGTLTNTLPFLAVGVLLRIMLRWITLGAAKTMMWCSIAALAAALFGVMLDAYLVHDLASTEVETFQIAPMMIAPFAGYGLATGIALLAWLRARPVRINRYEQPGSGSGAEQRGTGRLAMHEDLIADRPDLAAAEESRQRDAAGRGGDGGTALSAFLSRRRGRERT
jgi:hypothetical protein